MKLANEETLIRLRGVLHQSEKSIIQKSPRKAPVSRGPNFNHKQISTQAIG